MTEHELKGMGCEFDDLISDTAKVSETTGNGMSETELKEVQSSKNRDKAMEAMITIIMYMIECKTMCLSIDNDIKTVCDFIKGNKK